MQELYFTVTLHYKLYLEPKIRRDFMTKRFFPVCSQVHLYYNIFIILYIYSRTSMARTSSGP